MLVRYWKIIVRFSLITGIFSILLEYNSGREMSDLIYSDRNVWNKKIMFFREPLNDDYPRSKSNNIENHNNYNGNPTGNPNLYFKKKNSTLLINSKLKSAVSFLVKLFSLTLMISTIFN